MRVGILTRFGADRIDFAKKTGFKCVEIRIDPEHNVVPGHDGWQARADAYKAQYDEAGIRISCLAGFYVNHMDPAEADKWATHTRNIITLAEYWKIPVVAGFGGKLVDRPLEESVEPFKKIWTDHAKFAEDHNVVIAFENCPMGTYHFPPGGNNCMCTPDMWQRCFDAVGSDALGLEWDPSHLIGMMIDPIENVRQWVHKVYHVHAKDATINQIKLAQNGIYAAGTCEHCFAGFGDTDWGQAIKELVRGGYRGDLNIEGWHDQVYNDRLEIDKGMPAGAALTMSGEDLGLTLSYRYLAQFIDEA